MRTGYLSECSEWLTIAGLNVEPDKTELFFFKLQEEDGPRRPAPPTQPCAQHLLPRPSGQHTSLPGFFKVFFFDVWLNWTQLVEVVCNRARASPKALQLLGNSVRL